MKAIARKFVLWLMSLTTLMRYFVVAVLFHVLVLVVLGSIRIVTKLVAMPVSITSSEIPTPNTEENNREAGLIDYTFLKPSLGTGNAAPDSTKAMGEVRSGYTTRIAKTAADSAISDVIGVVNDAYAQVGRLQGSGLIGLTGPSGGLGDGGNKVDAGNMKGPGGTGFDQRQGSLRDQKIKAGHGTEASEKSVVAGLRWLKEHQESDGSWTPSAFPAAKTGLAALCFLGHGETPDSEEFGTTVSQALAYLADSIGPDGVVKSRNMYEQGIVTLALAEGYGMTQSPLAREPLDRAVNAILLSQKVKKTNAMHEGGWRYTPNSSDSDTSVAGWNIMGLKSARLAGIKIPQESFDAASQYLWNMYGEGGFGYVGPGVGNATTAVGILCEQFLGHGDDKRIKRSLELYMKQKVNWDTPANSLYGWYYTTQAMFQAGGNHWDYWNREIRDTLVKNQAGDGHWDDPGKDGGAKVREPVFSTTLCCLMLEVYYRYLPIYQNMEHKSSSDVRPNSP